MKKLFVILLTIIMVVSVSACKKESNDTSDKGISEQIQQAKEFIDTKDGTIKCVGVEKANSKLSDVENVYVVKFEFTNKKQEPQQCQNQFMITCFQNNVEINNIPTYNSEGGEQYELLGNYFKEALNGGTITFGQGFIAEDSSPITVVMRNNGGENEYMASVTLDIAELAAAKQPTSENVIADLQGEWDLEGTAVVFSENTVSFGGKISGTYTVNTETSNVEAEMIATDGKVTVKMPYEYKDGNLIVYNNSGKALVRK